MVANEEFCVSKLVGLHNKNSLKYYKNSLKQLTLTVHGLIMERSLRLRFGGFIFGRAYYRNFTLCLQVAGRSEGWDPRVPGAPLGLRNILNEKIDMKSAGRMKMYVI